MHAQNILRHQIISSVLLLNCVTIGLFQGVFYGAPVSAKDLSCSWKSVFCRFLDCHFQSFNFGFLSPPYRNILFFFQILKPVLIWRTVTVLFVCLFWWVLATWFIWNDLGLASFAPCPACGFSFSLRKRLLYNLSLFLLTRTRNWFSLA